VEFIQSETAEICDEHLKRFASRKNSWKKFVIINYAMSCTNIILPSDSKYHDIFFTYVHKTKTLYQGGNPVTLRPISEL
jgi:hypothetical protein